MNSSDEEHQVSHKGFGVLKNGATFWLFSFLILLVLGFYVHFFMVKQHKLLNHDVDFKFFTVKLNYVVFFALLWLSLLLFVLFN